MTDLDTSLASDTARAWVRAAALFLAPLVLTGCDDRPASTARHASRTVPRPVPDDEQLRMQLASVLDWTYAHRHLNFRDHAAWQIMHGVLAYKQSFLIETEPGGERKPVLAYLLNGGKMKGWTFEPGAVLDAASRRRGLRAILEAGTQTGQGHRDQWLAILAQCGVEPTQPLVVDGHRYTLVDLIEQVKLDVPHNPQREYSWTVIGLTGYLPTSATWTASDGQAWSIARLIESETEQELSTSACGGTHRLDALTLAVQRHVAQGGKLEGTWAAAEQKIQESIERVREHQHPDGSFSSNYFRPGGKSADLTGEVAVTGHLLEFLSLALTDEELQELWVARAVAHLCEIFENTKAVAWECGSLYHAINGLNIYHTRRFGKRAYQPREAVASPSGSEEP